MTAQSPEVLDFAKLLAPIAADKPAGDDLRADASPTSPYYALRDARKAAREAERPLERGEELDANAAPPDWRPVMQRGCEVLTKKSKDLEVSAYLIEALLRLHGFAGLRDGLRLARELVEHFWDHLYPTPDEDGLATRIAPLVGLNGEDAEGVLPAPIGRVPITELTSVGCFSCVHYRDAASLEKLEPKARKSKIDAGAVSLETVRKAIAESSPKFYQALVGDINQCHAELARLDAALNPRCQGNGPPTSALRAALDSSLDVVKELAKSKLEAPAATPGKAAPAPQEKGKDGQASQTTPAPDSNGLHTREDAFRHLLEIADFFRQTEPHTVVSYSLEQIVRWGRMSLPELLAELIPEDAARKNLFKQVGIKPPEPPGKSGDAKK